MTEPSSKRIKTNPSQNLSMPVKSEATMAVKSEEGSHDDDPVTVEFKFRSCKASLLEEEGQMTGTLNIPMLQDPHTGRFRIPAGMTKAKKKAKFTGYIGFQGHHLGRHFENAFTATFERPDESSPIQSVKLGYHLSGEQDESGFHSCLLNSEDEYDRDRDGHFCNEFQTYPADTTVKYVDRNLYRMPLNDWEANAGGMLTVFAKGEVDDTFLECINDEEKVDYEDSVWETNYKI
jgi:hypothetical protein